MLQGFCRESLLIYSIYYMCKIFVENPIFEWSPETRIRFFTEACLVFCSQPLNILWHFSVRPSALPAYLLFQPYFPQEPPVVRTRGLASSFFFSTNSTVLDCLRSRCCQTLTNYSRYVSLWVEDVLPFIVLKQIWLIQIAANSYIQCSKWYRVVVAAQQVRVGWGGSSRVVYSKQ